MPEVPWDPTAVEHALRTAAIEAWHRLLKQHPDERVYGLSLVDSAEQFALWQAWNQNNEPLDAYVAGVREVCVRVLAGLDATGLFGERRAGLTLQVENRDDEDAETRRDVVAALNPPDRLAAYDAWEQLYERLQAGD